MDFQRTDNSVLNAINKYKYYSRIVMIKSKIESGNIFSFTPIQCEDFLRKTKNSNVSKALQESDIPTNISIKNNEY